MSLPMLAEEAEVEAETDECRACGKTLTVTEFIYYEHRCEECERKAWLRLQRWRSGQPDPELDRMFGATEGDEDGESAPQDRRLS